MIGLILFFHFHIFVVLIVYVRKLEQEYRRSLTKKLKKKGGARERKT